MLNSCRFLPFEAEKTVRNCGNLSLDVKKQALFIAFFRRAGEKVFYIYLRTESAEIPSSVISENTRLVR